MIFYHTISQVLGNNTAQPQMQLVLNDFIEVHDKGHYCVSLFIDLSKSFDTVDFIILKIKLKLIVLSNDTISRF